MLEIVLLLNRLAHSAGSVLVKMDERRTINLKPDTLNTKPEN